MRNAVEDRIMYEVLPRRFTAGAFIAAALMLWFGWTLLPTKIGTYFEPGDFAQVRDDLHLWLWLFRVHLFGMVMTAVALVALGALLADRPARVMIWPGAAVGTAGMIVGAVGAAFYYHHAVWGAQELEGKSSAEVIAFIDALRVDTEYVTCLVRFGRVFSGLGLVLVGVGMLYAAAPSKWIGLGGTLIGLAAMGITMAVPDRMSLYAPVFHLLSLWLLATGIALWSRPASDGT